MLVDDHPMWRDTLRRVLEANGTATVVAEASDGEEALTLAREAAPDVVVMDVALPKRDGIDTTQALQTELPGAKVLMLSSSDDRSLVIRAVRAGASGYLVKTAGPDEVSQAVQRIHAGELAFPPTLASVVLDALRRPSAGGWTALDQLTAREADVLGLMAEGRSNQAISARLHLSPKTVEGYVAGIFMKLGLEPADSDHRRVLAVLAYLEARGALPGRP
jgi:DNA-binding NarL/FixJ family response regulator